ncbi:hypothetical protein NC652_010254 [Populus alba x Populus x berolinensis]|nr:hypothetical protein NC652_010254 [Populus alba x Populus x berolinensis]
MELKGNGYMLDFFSIGSDETTLALRLNVKLALEMRNLDVVGIDLSGNPVVGLGKRETFELARKGFEFMCAGDGGKQDSAAKKLRGSYKKRTSLLELETCCVDFKSFTTLLGDFELQNTLSVARWPVD